MKSTLFIGLFTLCFAAKNYGQQPATFYKSFDTENTEGVKGKAKCFDGYFTNDETSPSALSNPKNFTVEAWIAPQEYASTVAAIADRESGLKVGYLFGINQYGKLSASVAVGDKWITLVSNVPVALLKWAHVAMVVENEKAITLYINGLQSGNLILSGAITLCDSCKLSIGKTQTATTAANTERATSAFIKTQNRFDGLIDELYIHDSALNGDDIAKHFKAIKPANPQPLQFRQMPSGGSNGVNGSKFGAFYTKLS